MLRTVVLGFVLASALSLGACNTIKGMGMDIQSAGRAISGAAEKHSPNSDSSE
jgi:predicted small secreted protein